MLCRQNGNELYVICLSVIHLLITSAFRLCQYTSTQAFVFLFADRKQNLKSESCEVQKRLYANKSGDQFMMGLPAGGGITTFEQNKTRIWSIFRRFDALLKNK